MTQLTVDELTMDGWNTYLDFKSAFQAKKGLQLDKNIFLSQFEEQLKRTRATASTAVYEPPMLR